MLLIPIITVISFHSFVFKAILHIIEHFWLRIHQNLNDLYRLIGQLNDALLMIIYDWQVNDFS